MKKGELLRRLKVQGCVFIKHGKKHDVYKNPRTGIEERIPRHNEINENLAKHIIANLSSGGAN
jgi:mRNA interferase HicA